MALDTTPGLTSDAYVQIADVDAYHLALNNTKFVSWTEDTDAAGIAAQERGIRLATKIIDEHFIFLGTRTLEELQVLDFPRTDVPRDGNELVVKTPNTPGLSNILHGNPIDDLLLVPGLITTIELLDKDTIPQFLKDATSELALELLNAEREEKDIYGMPKKITDNIQTKTVGGALSVTFFDPNGVLNLGEGIIKSSAWIKLTKYGSYKINTNTPGFNASAGIA